MNWRSIFDPQKRSRFIAKSAKFYRQTFSRPVSTTPVFILGCQRSGTTMLMFSFHLHPDIAVFDESGNNIAFTDFRLRGFANTKNIIENCAFPVACFKPLADSHLTYKILQTFPSARCIWMLRNYNDTANSFLKKFPHATRAIRFVCTGKEGGGWFQEGISSDTRNILRSLPWQEFVDFDFSCLVWWARNRLFFEQQLNIENRVLLLKYEDLVTDQNSSLKTITDFIGIPYSVKMGKYFHKRSISRSDVPKLHQSVKYLCDDLFESFKK